LLRWIRRKDAKINKKKLNAGQKLETFLFIKN